MDKIIVSFFLTFIAGFSTLFGIIFIFFKVENINKFLCSILAFASGVMFIVSITDLIPESLFLLSDKYNKIQIITISFISIFLGISISTIIDYFLQKDNQCDDNKLYKVGLISMLAIIMHNIPEGIATFIAGNSNINLALSLTIAIAMHNIPEGISIAVPIYYSTKNKTKTIIYTLISALSEPFGAFLAYLFLEKMITNTFLGILFSGIAGIMLQISICELLPESKKYNYKKETIFFFIIGIFFMLIKYII